jgi:hypothetical protein
MSPKRVIKAKDVIRDIHSGMTTSQLIEKYRFSAKELRLIFRKLLEASVMTRDELNSLTTLDQNPEGAKGVRRAIRKISPFPVRIYDNGHPFATGYVRNVSEKGVCLEGIEASVGDVKGFIVRSGTSDRPDVLVFEAKCRWVRKEGKAVNGVAAGFEITDISNLDAQTLRKLLLDCH